MNAFKTIHARFLRKHRAPRKGRVDPYPLLGLLLVLLAAVLGYGAAYLLLSA